VVLGEFDRNEAQPTFAMSRAMDSALWMPYVSRKQPLGQRQVIQNASVEQMKMIKERFYHPNNSALIVSGDVNANEVFSLAKRYFADWKRGADPFPAYAPPAFPAQQPALVLRPAKIPDVEIGMVFRGPSIGRDEPDTYAALLLGTLLDQPTSRLFHRMIDSGMALEADAGYSSASNTGKFNFYLTTNSAKARQAVDLLKEEIEAMGRPGYFTAEEIETARKIVSDRQTFDQENPYSFAIRTTARWWSIASPEYYLSLPANVGAVTEGELQAFVRKYLAGRPFVLGVGAESSNLNKLNFSEEVLTW
jgi:zinc protease